MAEPTIDRFIAALGTDLISPKILPEADLNPVGARGTAGVAKQLQGTAKRSPST